MNVVGAHLIKPGRHAVAAGRKVESEHGAELLDSFMNSRWNWYVYIELLGTMSSCTKVQYISVSSLLLQLSAIDACGVILIDHNRCFAFLIGVPL